MLNSTFGNCSASLFWLRQNPPLELNNIYSDKWFRVMNKTCCPKRITAIRSSVCDRLERLKLRLVQKSSAVMMIIVQLSVLLVFTASSWLGRRWWLELCLWACSDQEVTSSYFLFIAAYDTDVCIDKCSEVCRQHLEGRLITTHIWGEGGVIYGGLDSFVSFFFLL